MHGWQNANVIQAPAIQFDRNHRSVVAQGTPTQPVSTVLVQVEKSGKVTPVKITSDRLTYTDSERKAHFEEAVQAKGADLTITSKMMDVFLQPRDQAISNQSITGTGAGTGKIDHIVASGRLRSSNRVGGRTAICWLHHVGRQVCTHGRSPSIFDADRARLPGFR